MSRISLSFLLLSACLQFTTLAEHHMKRKPVQWVNKRASDVPLVVTNHCDQVIYPGILTQSGTGPESNGFKLDANGDSKKQTVSANWQGRVWPRTNCSFNADGTMPANGAPGKACLTGDCGGTVACGGTGEVPASLAEFTLETGTGQTYYDISLVDGYNVPVGIISLSTTSGNESLTDIPPNLTNPICVGTAALLTAASDAEATNFGTNSSYPIPLANDVSQSQAARWCPWDLQLNPPKKPGDGVYPYPDDNIQRPTFQPCYSACAKWGKPEYCCTGSHDSPSKCKPTEYSTQAKKVCPDAYSYAFDDQDSTFIIPSGGGFEVVFCPPGRSSNILKVLASQLQQLAQTGHVTQQILADTQNLTLIRSSSDAGSTKNAREQRGSILAAVVLIGVCAWLF